MEVQAAGEAEPAVGPAAEAETETEDRADTAAPQATNWVQHVLELHQLLLLPLGVAKLRLLAQLVHVLRVELLLAPVDNVQFVFDNQKHHLQVVGT